MFWIKRYINLEVKDGEIKARNLETGETFVRRCEALDHPRTLMGDFVGVETCITKALNTLAPKKFLSPGPVVYIHLLDKVEGGVTSVEARAFREATITGGAREIHVPKAERPLSFENLKNKNFKNWDDE